MDRKLAEEIHEHLLDASDALRRAEWAGQKLKGYEERKALIELMADVITPLHFELMPALYAEHPQLKPPHEPSSISSLLRWEDVSLPKSVSTEDLDAAIFAVLKPRSQKVAKVIPEAAERCKAPKARNRFEIIGAGILALAEAGRIEGAGDLQRWMHSEVKLLP
jgi:hypothetical protein